MPFFSNLKKVLNLSAGEQKKKKPNFQHVLLDKDPEEVWEIVGELGDGAFGKVHKVNHREKEICAAAKICELESEDELTDFMVEIDILSEISHENVIKLYESFYFQNKLWVSLLPSVLHQHLFISVRLQFAPCCKLWSRQTARGAISPMFALASVEILHPDVFVPLSH